MNFYEGKLKVSSAFLALFGFVFSVFVCPVANALETLGSGKDALGFNRVVVGNFSTDNDFERYLHSSSQYEKQSGGDYLYKASDYLLAGFSSYSIESFREGLYSDTREKLIVDKYIPVLVGGITTFIPVYSNNSILENKNIRFVKKVGDPYVQQEVVTQQVKAALGRSLITRPLNPRYSSVQSQLIGLYKNAIRFSSYNPEVEYGEVLKYSQMRAPIDMIWPELRMIDGEYVLVPVLYLTSTTVHEFRILQHEIGMVDGADIAALKLEETDLELGRDAFIRTVGELTLKNSKISSIGDLKLIAGGEFNLLSSKVISTDGDVTIAGKSVNAETIVYKYDFGSQSGVLYGQITGIEGNDVRVHSYDDLNIIGSYIDAEGGIRLSSDGNIYIGSVVLPSGFSGQRDGWNEESSVIDFLTSNLNAVDTIEMIAKGGVLIEGANIASDKGQVEILAALGVSIVDNLSQNQVVKKGKFGKTSKNVSAYKTVAIRSVLDAGKGVRIHSEFGDIKLKATDITSTEGATVTAKRGKVELLTTKQQDHYNYSAVTKGLFTTKTRNKGHEVEAIATPTFVGGVKVNAAKGITIEFEGNPDLNTAQQIRELSKLEGMEYLDDLLDRDDVDWNEIETVVKEWSKTKRSLSPAAIAVLSIAVAVAAGPAAAGVSTVVGGGTTGVMMSAAFTSIVNTAVISLANGNSIAATLDTLGGDENLKSLAVSMVTAGAMAKLDAAFFDIPADGELSVLYETPEKLSYTGQAVQSVTHATAKASIQSAFNGGEFDDVFVQSLAADAQAKLGEYMASQIKAQWDVPGADAIDHAMRYAAHAGAGCILGGISAEINSSTSQSDGCSAGAGGAVVGELIGDIYKSNSEVGQDVEELEQFLADQGLTDASQLTAAQKELLRAKDISVTVEQLRDFHKNGIDIARLGVAVGAFIAGADAGQINVADMTAQNAVENNALFLIPIAIALLKAIDIALTIEEYAELYSKIDDAKGDEDEIKSILIDHFGGSLEEAVVSEIARKLLPGAQTIDKMMEIFVNSKAVSPETVAKMADKQRQQKQILEQTSQNGGAKVSPSGNIGCKTGQANACQIDPRTQEEIELKAEVSQLQVEYNKALKSKGASHPDTVALKDAVSKRNEDLTDIMLTNRGFTPIATAEQLKTSGNRGFDHVYEAIDENGDSILLIVDSKQLKNGGTKLGKPDSGVQLSEDWILETARNLPNSSPAKQTILDAVRNGSYKAAVAGHDKVTNDFKLIGLDFDNV